MKIIFLENTDPEDILKAIRYAEAYGEDANTMYVFKSKEEASSFTEESVESRQSIRRKLESCKIMQDAQAKRIKELEAENAKLAQAKGTQEAEELMVKSYEARIEQLKKRLDKAQAELLVLRGIEFKVKSPELVTRLQETIRHCERRIQQLQKENEVFRKGITHLSEQEGIARRLEEEKTRLRADLRHLEATLETERAEAEKVKDEFKDLKTRHLKLATEYQQELKQNQELRRVVSCHEGELYERFKALHPEFTDDGAEYVKQRPTPTAEAPVEFMVDGQWLKAYPFFGNNVTRWRYAIRPKIWSES